LFYYWQSHRQPDTGNRRTTGQCIQSTESGKYVPSRTSATQAAMFGADPLLKLIREFINFDAGTKLIKL
jgi:hypothetical protein